MKAIHFTKVAAISGFLAVSLGAFGAHALKGHLNSYQLDIWQTAVFYHFVHTLLLLLLSLQNRWFEEQPKKLISACFATSVGIILFSGSLYLLAVLSIKWLGLLTPLGGLLFLLAWFLLFVISINSGKTNR